MPDQPVLHMIAGKIASGKSTLAAELSAGKGTVRISEDAWLNVLFGDQMTTPKDYVRCTARLRAAVGPHVGDLLRAGVSVVLDFAANTPEVRSWMREIVDDTGAAHRLHVLQADDALCLDRLRARNASGAHPFSVTVEQFHLFTQHYVPPQPDEGFDLVFHPQTG